MSAGEKGEKPIIPEKKVDLGRLLTDFSLNFDELGVGTARLVTQREGQFGKDVQLVQKWIRADKENIHLMMLNPLRNKTAAEYLGDEIRVFWIIEINGQPIAYTHIHNLTPESQKHGNFFVTTYILPSHQGRGIGLKIRLALLRHLQQAGGKKLTSHVLLHNQNSFKFNMKAGLAWQTLGGAFWHTQKQDLHEFVFEL